MTNDKLTFNKLLSDVAAIPRLIGPYEREAARGRHYVARLGANESQFGPSPAAIQVLETRGRLTNLYGDPNHVELRTLIAERWKTSLDNIVVGEGVEGLLEHFARAFVEPGDAVVITRGTYSTLAYYVRSCGGRTVQPGYTDDLRINIDALADYARRNAAKLVYLANPDNPTGSVVPPRELKELIRQLPSSCLLLLDEAYAEFAPDDCLLPDYARWQNLVRMRSFSKAHGLAGARVGYVIAAPEVTRVIELVRQRYGVSKLSQEMAAAAFDDVEYIRSVRVLAEQARKHYSAIADDLGVRTLPSEANFLTFDFGDPLLASRIVRGLDQHDILTMQPTELALSRLVRVTAAPQEQRSYFEQCLRKIYRDLAEHGVFQNGTGAKS